MNRLVLIDGNALVHRAYHALPKTFQDASGNPTNAIFGFASMLIKLIQEVSPDGIAVAFDSPGPTFRHHEYGSYKEGRPEADEELAEQIPRVQQLVADFGLPYFELEAYEADDLVAALKKQALAEGVEEILIVSGDMDLAQLVDAQTKLGMPRKGLSDLAIYDISGVKERYGVWPNQIVDYKALRGDPSDNIPGVWGIGEKTAISLLERFDDLEGVYANLGEIKPVVMGKLAAASEDALLSRKIARIVDDVPIKLDLAKCEWGEGKQERGIKALRELGFKSLVKRLGNVQSQIDLDI